MPPKHRPQNPGSHGYTTTAKKAERTGVTGALTDSRGQRYTAEEWEFVQAMEAWKKRTKRKFPDTTDYFRELLRLGYRKVAAPEDPACPSPPTSPPKSKGGRGGKSC
jgi:hypothetical protein